MEIVLAGSVSYDYIMAYPGRFRDLLTAQALGHLHIEFQVESMQLHHGGVSANIAYTLALLGGRPRLFSTVGPDFQPYRERLERIGVDCSTVVTIPEVWTGRFFANTDSQNNQLGAFYAGGMAYAGDFGILEVAKRKPDLVVISPNAPKGMSRQVEECLSEGIAYIFDPSQQVALLDSEVLRRGIAGCYALTCNEYEWEVIEQRTGYHLPDLLAQGHIFIHTLGENGANIYAESKALHIPAYPPERVINPTGAGDAFRGGLLRGWSLGLPWEVAGRMGALCGTYALEHMGTQEHEFSLTGFIQRYRQIWDDDGLLEALVN
jgi:adenosine kinase